MAATCLVLLVMALSVVVPYDRLEDDSLLVLPERLAVFSLKTYTLAILGSQFLANYLGKVIPRR